MKIICAAVLCLMLTGPVAWAKETFAKYPVFFVKKHVVPMQDTELHKTRQKALAAIRLRDMEKLGGMFADQVVIFQAKLDPAGVEEDKFVEVEKVPGKNVARAIGELKNPAGEISAAGLVRSGMFVLAHIFRADDFGHFEKLGGRVCNRAVGIADVRTFAKAAEVTKSRLAEWRVARKDMAPDGIAGETDSYDQPLSAGQMVWMMPDAHPDGAWTHIVDPETGKPLSYRHKPPYNVRAPFFAPYVSEHVCFDKQNGTWKIVAIAVRVP